MQATEERLSLSRAAKLPVLERDGRSPNPCLLWRWGNDGVLVNGQRVFLEIERRGGRISTTAEAVKRFLARCTVREPDLVRTPLERKRAHEAAERRLAAAGI